MSFWWEHFTFLSFAQSRCLTNMNQVNIFLIVSLWGCILATLFKVSHLSLLICSQGHLQNCLNKVQGLKVPYSFSDLYFLIPVEQETILEDFGFKKQENEFCYLVIRHHLFYYHMITNWDKHLNKEIKKSSDHSSQLPYLKSSTFI